MLFSEFYHLKFSYFVTMHFICCLVIVRRSDFFFFLLNVYSYFILFSLQYRIKWTCSFFFNPLMFTSPQHNSDALCLTSCDEVRSGVNILAIYVCPVGMAFWSISFAPESGKSVLPCLSVKMRHILQFLYHWF